MVVDPAKYRRAAAGLLPALLVMFIALVPRLVMLGTVERRLDADESIVGLMAKHIHDGEGVPLFFYGQHYGGGHVIEALPAALWRSVISGPSSAAVQFTPLLFSVLTIGLVFLFIRAKYGVGAAGFSALVLSFSTPYLKSSLKADGYIETIFFGLLLFVILEAAQKAEKGGNSRKSTSLLVLMGLVAGLSVWSYDFALIFVATAFIAALVSGILLKLHRILIFGICFVIGAVPLVIDNVVNNGAHLQHLFSGGPAGIPPAAEIARNFLATFTAYLPAFYTPDSVHNFVLPPPWYSWVFIGVITVSILFTTSNKKIPLYMLIIPILTLIAFCVSGYAGRSPRYLLPIEPYFSIVIGVAIAGMLRHARPFLRVIGTLVAIFAVIALFAGTTAVFSDDSVVESNLKTNPDSLPHIVSYLLENEIDCVDTSKFIKWRILFLSDEKIIATDSRASEKEGAYLRYEHMGCPSDTPPALVFHRADPGIDSVPSILDLTVFSYRVFRTSDHVAIIPVFRKQKDNKEKKALPGEMPAPAPPLPPPVQ